jgi:hypothetical protein
MSDDSNFVTDETVHLAGVSQRIVEQVKPLLAGHDPAVQGAALADLLSLWLAGHHPDLRERMLTMLIEGVRALIPFNENEHWQ